MLGEAVGTKERTVISYTDAALLHTDHKTQKIVLPAPKPTITLA